MRYAIVSDVHANLPAWETVLADITALNADVIICLGDVVGYGPQPAETLSSVHASVDYLVLGNHDAALCGLLPTDAFNDDAASMIRWTRQQVDPKALEFLKHQPLVVHGDGFVCAHGTAMEPSRFAYVHDEEDTRECLAAVSAPLVFVGHTHTPGIHYLNRNDEFRQVDAVDFIVEEGKRYVINPGSVGMARGEDFRASYCIYDAVDLTVTFRQVAYDVNALRQAAFEQALDCEQLHYVLELFDDNRRAPVRQLVDFSPAEADSDNYVTDQQIAAGTRAWRRAFTVAMLLVILLGACSWMLWRHVDAVVPTVEALNVQGTDHGPLLLAKEVDDYVEFIKTHAPAAQNEPLAQLSFLLSRPDASSVRKLDKKTICLKNTATDGKVVLVTPKLLLDQIAKIQSIILFEAETDNPPSLFIDHVLADGSVVEGADFKNAVPLRTGGYRIQRTTKPFPKGVKAAILRLKWTGTGSVTVRSFAVRSKG